MFFGVLSRTISAFYFFKIQCSLCFCLLRRFTYYLRWGKSSPQPKKLIFIETKSVVYKLEPIQRLPNKLCTNIFKGNWDKYKITLNNLYDHKGVTKPGLIPLESFALYDAIYKLIKHKTPFKETLLYKNRINNKTQSHEQLTLEFKKIQCLQDSLISKGYTPQNKLNKKGGLLGCKSFQYLDEVRVAIGRDGELFLEDGVHRFFLAHILEIKKIPVRVIIRHTEWQKKRKLTYKALKTNNGACLEKKTREHPDLQEFLK